MLVRSNGFHGDLDFRWTGQERKSEEILSMLRTEWELCPKCARFPGCEILRGWAERGQIPEEWFAALPREGTEPGCTEAEVRCETNQR